MTKIWQSFSHHIQGMVYFKLKPFSSWCIYSGLIQTQRRHPLLQITSNVPIYDIYHQSCHNLTIWPTNLTKSIVVLRTPFFLANFPNNLDWLGPSFPVCFSPARSRRSNFLMFFYQIRCLHLLSMKMFPWQDGGSKKENIENDAL